MSHALTGIFVVHLVVFTALGVRRGAPRCFALSCTFASLTTLYALKSGLVGPGAAALPAGGAVALRAAALSSTAAYLLLTGREPGTWVARLVAREPAPPEPSA